MDMYTLTKWGSFSFCFLTEKVCVRNMCANRNESPSFQFYSKIFMQIFSHKISDPELWLAEVQVFGLVLLQYLAPKTCCFKCHSMTGTVILGWCDAFPSSHLLVLTVCWCMYALACQQAQLLAIYQWLMMLLVCILPFSDHFFSPWVFFVAHVMSLAPLYLVWTVNRGKHFQTLICGKVLISFIGWGSHSLQCWHQTWKHICPISCTVTIKIEIVSFPHQKV